MPYYHYMDLKDQPDALHAKDMKRKTLEVIEAIKPDFLIIVDDRAQKLVGQEYIDHKDIKVIYCGVKRSPKDYGYHKAKNVTGIQVSLPLHILNDLLTFNIDEGDFDHKIHLIPLSDNTITSQQDDEVIVVTPKGETIYHVKFVR